MALSRIALLIDADNAPASKIGEILNDLASYGECNIRRAYGNWTKPDLKGWIEELHDAAIRPMQQFDLTTHKNASDMALAIDAVELWHSAEPEAFAIVSSDSDFTPLVHYLREKGAAVYGYGRAKTPTPFQSACTKFTVLEQLGEDESDGTEEQSRGGREQVPTADLKGNSALVRLLRSAIKAAAGEDGWATVQQVGQQIRNQSSLDWRNYGYGTLTKLLTASELFEMRDEGTPAVSVRDPRANRS
ncbi:NYN domain-containing protein [Nocardioides sp. CER19]|uniref:NYN domain-containing protein n=1 Tax=Nocardioides sp. CER19 TaxID=3038538 RepID=UPI00244C9D6F|nr:NYN domain-containing protein [Nocardioides sp. CER19]MDH2414099.1 NYN domain-containing protein [Nocardioides sp. CER19]